MTTDRTQHRSIALNMMGVPPAVYDAMQATLEAGSEGLDAALAGLPESTNPFTPDDIAHCGWAAGYARGLRDSVTA